MLIRYVDERVRTLKKDRTAADYQVKQLCNGLRIEENYLVNTSVRKNEEDLLKIRSDVFETNDNEYIKDIFQYDTSTFLKPNFTIRPSLRVIRNRLDLVSDKNGVIISERCASKFEFASLLFFQNLSKINEAIINLVQLLIWFSSVQLAIDKNKKQLIVSSGSFIQNSK